MCFANASSSKRPVQWRMYSGTRFVVFTCKYSPMHPERHFCLPQIYKSRLEFTRRVAASEFRLVEPLLYWQCVPPVVSPRAIVGPRVKPRVCKLAFREKHQGRSPRLLLFLGLTLLEPLNRVQNIHRIKKKQSPHRGHQRGCPTSTTAAAPSPAATRRVAWSRTNPWAGRRGPNDAAPPIEHNRPHC